MIRASSAFLSICSQAITLALQVRKCLAVNSPPVASLIYSLTSLEVTGFGSPSPLTYWNSIWPGRSWQRLQMRLRLVSVIFTSCTIPCFPANRIISPCPVRLRWRRRKVVAPKLLFSFAYCSLPIRICSVSSSRTTAASTASRQRSRRFRSDLDPAAQSRQCLSEFEETFIFGALALGAEIGVIAILLAPARIDSSCLEVAVRIGAKPRILIGRRKSDRVQSIDLVAVRDALPVRVEIGPITALPLAADSRLRIAAVP